MFLQGLVVKPEPLLTWELRNMHEKEKIILLFFLEEESRNYIIFANNFFLVAMWKQMQISKYSKGKKKEKVTLENEHALVLKLKSSRKYWENNSF